MECVYLCIVIAVVPRLRTALADICILILCQRHFKDIYSGSLDSVVFKYELNKALRKLEMRPTRCAVTNIMLYKDAHRKYQVQR